MTDQADQELPRAKRRRLIIAAVLRGLAVTTVLVVLYYLLPMDSVDSAGHAANRLIGRSSGRERSAPADGVDGSQGP